MKKFIFCMAFIGVHPESALLVPDNVQSLLKNRILVQLKQQNSKVDWAFDDAQCTESAHYSFSGDQIALEGSNSFWEGQLSLSIQDVLEGKKMYFEHFFANPMADITEPAKPNHIPWAKIGVASLVGGVVIFAVKALSHGGASTPPTAAEQFNPTHLKH